MSTVFERPKVANCVLEALKDLIRTHREALEKHSKIDVEAVLNITYLNEFDRLIQ